MTQITKKENNNIILAYPLYIATFAKGTDTRTVIHHRWVCFCIIQWEKIKSSGPTQCYRCQSFGYIAANCTRLPRCVTCGNQHNSRECPNKDRSPNCANCGESHPASYSLCTKRPRKHLDHNKQERINPVKFNQKSFPPLNRSTNTATTPTWSTQS